MAKADGAEIPYHLWREQIEHVLPGTVLPEDWEDRVAPLRNCMLRWWKRRVTESVGNYRRLLETKQDIKKQTNSGVRWDHLTTSYIWIIEPKE